jgi:DNA-binding GntR family transcriptional regulator
MSAESAIRTLYERHAGTGSTADAIYVTMAEGILSLALPAGWRLGEERLATLFSASRTPVREALTRLESEGLAARTKRRGLIVATITTDQVFELYAIREALDGTAARLAAHARTDADITTLQQANERIQRAARENDLPTLLGANVAFHQALAAASRNEMLKRFVAQIHQTVLRFRSTTLSVPGRADEAVAEHEAIIEAIRDRDEELAEEAARRHMRHVVTARMAMPLEDPEENHR